MKKLITLIILSMALLSSDFAVQHEHIIACTNVSFEKIKTEYDERKIKVFYTCGNLDANKTIVGFVQSFLFKDVFGKTLYENTSNITQTIKPLDQASIFAEAKDNPFIYDELYDILEPSVTNKSIKTTLTIDKILYSDGSEVAFKATITSKLFSPIDKKVTEKKKEPVVNVKKEEVASKSTTTSKWFTPTDKAVKWKKAKQICRDNGGRLLTIEELKEVMTDCGGINTTFDDKDWDNVTDKNKANKSYQSCYKDKGFRYSLYWSSTSYVGIEDTVWFVNFYFGDVLGGVKTSRSYVRCVRDGQ